MKDEIKEIFDTKLYFDLDEEDYIKIKDHITNLQEERERLKNDIEDISCSHFSLFKQYEDYKSRIDKAYKITTEFENWLQDSDLVARATIIDLICDIQKALTGSDE